jgi:DNA invertase Pin-like site-specific DNA recombinase
LPNWTEPPRATLLEHPTHDHEGHALAEFERALIVERTQAELKAARKRGAKLGRRPALSEAQRQHVAELLDRGESPAAVAKLLKVCRATLYNSLKRP